MGLLDSGGINFDDPKTLGLLSAALQMMSPTPVRMNAMGQISQGLLGGMGAYAGARKSQLDMAREMQQNKLLDLQTQQAQQVLDREKARATALQGAFGDGQSAPPSGGLLGSPQPMPTSQDMAESGGTLAPPPAPPMPQPPQMQRPSDPRAAMRGLYYSTAQSLAKQGFGDDAQKFFDMALKLEDEYSPTPQTLMVGGKPVSTLVSKQGNVKQLDQYAPKPDYKSVDTGSRTGFVDPLTGQLGPTFAKNMTPGESANLGIAKAKLGIEAANSDPFGMLGIRQIAQQAGAPIGAPALGGNAPGGATPASAQAAEVHGQDLLQNLPQPIGAQVKALAEGRQPFPGGFAMKSPYWQTMLSLVGQYDPNFDMVNFNARSGVRKDFTSGKSAISLNALNTVGGHLDELEKAVDALHNSNFTPYNMVANPVKKAFGATDVTNFQTVLQTVMPELERAYRGSGGSEGSLQRWQSALAGTNGYNQQKAAIKELATLLNSKIDSLGDQYSKGMGTTSNGLQLLSPKAQAVFSRLTGQDVQGNARGGSEMSGFRVLGKE